MIGSAAMASAYVASGKADTYKKKKLIYGILQLEQL
jgi:fructose-1,6-bisphosphatase/inositol monophosphatase family enzyme